MGRTPEGEQALTGAERQARYRARHGLPMATIPVLRDRSPGKARTATRVQRWHAAVDALVALQAEYAAWLQALPDNQRDSAMAEALQAIVELDLSELQTIEPPRGFGRD